MSVEDDKLNFTFFPKLPLEIRDMIWAEGCKEERIIDVRAVAISDLQDEDFFMRPADAETPKPYMVKSFTYTVPAILHTSQEARKVGLKHYSLDFGTDVERKVGPASIKISTPARIYVNWNCDIIFQLPPPDKSSRVKRRPLPFNEEMNVLMCKDLMVNRPQLRRIAFNGEPASFFNAETLLYFLTHCKLDDLIIYPYVWEAYDILETHGPAARIGFVDLDDNTKKRFCEEVEEGVLDMDVAGDLEIKVLGGILLLLLTHSLPLGKRRYSEKRPMKVMSFQTPDRIGSYFGRDNW